MREDSLILRQRMRNHHAAAPTFGKVVRFSRILLVSSILAVDLLTIKPGEKRDSISHVAHLVGAAVGLLVGLVLLRNRRVEHWEAWVSHGCVPPFILNPGNSGSQSGVLPGRPGNPCPGNPQPCRSLHIAPQMAA